MAAIRKIGGQDRIGCSFAGRHDQTSPVVTISGNDLTRGRRQSILFFHIGNLLAGARLKAGLTQAQLAHELGIRQNMVSNYENGRRTYSDTMAKRPSAVLKVKEEHLRYGRTKSSMRRRYPRRA